MASISLCMIVKNEANILERCLNSYAGIYDELIIVDTGSTDNTKEIASKYTEKIYDFTWINDFAAARNYAFSLCNCEYILSVDADEMVDNYNNQMIRNLKAIIDPEIDIVQMFYITSSEFNSNYNTRKELRPKLFKRLRSFTWISPIHETVRTEPLVFNSDIEIIHKPEGSHSGRDFSIIKQTALKGEFLENYVVSMLCMELFISGTDENFIDMACCFTDILSKEQRPPEIEAQISCVLARIYRITKDIHAFFKLTTKAVASDPPAEICMELGKYYMSLSDYEEAILWFYNATYETEAILDVSITGNKGLFALSESYKALAEITDDKPLAVNYMNLADAYYEQANAWVMPEKIEE